MRNNRSSGPRTCGTTPANSRQAPGEPKTFWGLDGLEAYDGSCREAGDIVRVCVLASSSSCNCTFVAAGNTRILIDAGLSYRQLCLRLEAIGEDATQIDAVFVTHEHSDHVAGVPMLARHGIPIYLTKLTAPGIDWGKAEPVVREFQAGSEFDMGELRVTSFTIPHDTVDPVGYTVRSNGTKIAVVTDLGYIPENVKYHLQGSHLMLLESNHDASMLQVGPVPWFVKQRILSRKGHLSNTAASQYIADDLPADVQTLLLGHLSQNHNDPCIAEIEARQALERRGLRPRLEVLERERPSEIFYL